MLNTGIKLLAIFLSLLAKARTKTILDFVAGRSDLSRFHSVLQRPGLHRVMISRAVTILIPNNNAMEKFKGRLDENLALNHLINSAIHSNDLQERESSLVTGSPPIWVTKRSGWLYFNQARAVERDIDLESDSSESQVVYVIDSVLEPLVTRSIRDTAYTQAVDAAKLLAKSTLYNIGDEGRVRLFYEQAVANGRDRMFGVAGRHTFFLPVDSSFLEGQSCDPDQHIRTVGAACEVRQRVEKRLVDAKVVEGHIVPSQLLLTSLIPTQEFRTVAWEVGGVQVNVSLQPSGDVDGMVMVRSNTVKGDRVHATGMVVARILKGNIPVQNGIVHLIDKPLMVVAKSVYDYVMEEGAKPGNRLSTFAQLIRDKGGRFGETLLESKDGTLLAPSNAAFEKVDRARLNYVLGEDLLRQEFLGLHFVRERIASNDPRILATSEAMYSVPASWAFNRVWFNYNPRSQTLSVEGRGANSSAIEKDIGTINGVIHVVDTLLGVPSFTVAEKMRMDPDMRHTYALAKFNRMDGLLQEDRPGRKITFVVPTNAAWEKIRVHYTKTFESLTDSTLPHFARGVLERHLKFSSRPFTIEQLTEKSLRNPRRTVEMERGDLMFTKTGEIEYNAYKEWYVAWREVKGKIVRPNIECTNGYIHLVDSAMLDDSPAWTVGGGGRVGQGGWNMIMVMWWTVAARLVL